MKQKIQRWIGKAAVILLDSYTPDSRGGTGETFNWEIAAGYVGTFIGVAEVTLFLT